MQKTLFTRMKYLESLYKENEGNLHKILNRYELNNIDFDYLLEVKAYNNQ